MDYAYRPGNGLLYYSHVLTEQSDERHIERHCHDHYELLYIVYGEGKVVVEGAEYPMRPHLLILIRPYEFHYVCPAHGTRYERYVIEFQKSFPDAAVRELPMMKRTDAREYGICFSGGAVDDDVRQIFSKIDDVKRMFIGVLGQEEKETALMRAYVTELLLRISLPTSEPDGSRLSRDDTIVQVIDYLNRHLYDPISLDALAKRFFVSKYHLCHAFRRHTGISLLSYVQGKRIARAEHLIAKGEPATEVAYRVGFGNYSSFYRAYCKQLGCPPVRSRQAVEEREECLKMEIRQAKMEELDAVMQIYEGARAFMTVTGNPDQWGATYPPRELIERDIERGCCYVASAEDGLWGVFYFAVEDDPTYAYIKGAWLNDRPYAVLHRVAVAKQGRGVVSRIFEYAVSQYPNIKIDTHENNLPMQRALTKNGFTACGEIYLANGDARIAYQRCDEV